MNQVKKIPLEMTLCNRCASVYYADPCVNIRRKDYSQTIKESCDICRTRKGFDFLIQERTLDYKG